MEIHDELIHKLSVLSRLKFEGEELTAIRADLTRMLQFVQKVQGIDTEGVLPFIHPTFEHNRFREDVPLTDITQHEALLNAPKRDSDYFRVPKFIEK